MLPSKGFRLVATILAISIAIFASGCRSAKDASLGPPPDLPKNDTVSVNVYYPLASGEIVQESHVVEKTANLPKAALDELFKLAPSSKKVSPDLPPATVLGIAIAQGTATVNFDRAILGFKGEPKAQTAALAAIVSTLTQFKEIKQVQFQVEGKTSGTIDGHDIQGFWGSITLKNQPWKM